jgi:hypothetical protein
MLSVYCNGALPLLRQGAPSSQSAPLARTDLDAAHWIVDHHSELELPLFGDRSSVTATIVSSSEAGQ